MKKLTKEEYTDLYKTCKEMNIKHIQSLKKTIAFLVALSLFLGFMAYISYPLWVWQMLSFFSVILLLVSIFIVLFYMPTAWLKRQVKNFPGKSYQELQAELDSYL